jgi:hypothetical protein
VSNSPGCSAWICRAAILNVAAAWTCVAPGRNRPNTSNRLARRSLQHRVAESVLHGKPDVGEKARGCDGAETGRHDTDNFERASHSASHCDR